MKLRLHLFLIIMLSTIFTFGQITSVGIIGTATPDDWNSDVDMIQHPDSAHLWTLTIYLKTGFAKFRADNDWKVNWGAKEFPSGVATQGGPDIPTYAGDYTVTFNSNTGAYYFDVDSDIGIIGSATAGDWGSDTDLYIDQTDTNQYYTVMVLKSGEAKFRQNDTWDISWGATDFPTGTGTLGGPNIPIANAGKYSIKFNKSTGAYSFEELKDYEFIGVVGSATAGGWDIDTDLKRDGTNPDIWKGRVDLVVGELKFRADHKWATSWGGTDFPKGIATLTGGNIPVNEAGKYQVTFNTKTGEYDFLFIKPYNAIGIIGSATPGEWMTDTDMVQDGTDPTIWRLRMKLTEGEAKFRANDDWDVNWGAVDFPKGVAEIDGPNIPITAGDYKITFNTLSGEYEFEAVIEFEKISIVGEAGPFGDWPGSDDSRDSYMVKDPNDINHWTLASITLKDAAVNGGIKFRAEAAWAKNWGAVDFPNGVGTQDGPNILCKAGTYKVDFKSDTGEYGYAEGSATYDILSNATINVFPNPTAAQINIEIREQSLKGKAIKATLYNNTGKVVYDGELQNDQLSIDASKLISGQYLIQLSGDHFFVGRLVTVIK